jgi:hypothetical protein
MFPVRYEFVYYSQEIQVVCGKARGKEATRKTKT